MKSRMGSRVLGVRSEILNKLTKSSLRRSHLSRYLEEVREMSTQISKEEAFMQRKQPVKNTKAKGKWNV